MDHALDPLLTALDRLATLYPTMAEPEVLFLARVSLQLAEGVPLDTAHRRKVFRLLDVYDPALAAELAGQQRLFEEQP